jgi:hypothetical protein
VCYLTNPGGSAATGSDRDIPAIGVLCLGIHQQAPNDRFQSDRTRLHVPITKRAVEESIKPAGPPFYSRDPGPDLPRRVVPSVLGVPAFEVRYPVTFIVLVKPNDAPFHGHVIRVRPYSTVC